MPRVEELPDDHDDSQTSSVRASSTRDLEIPQPQGLSSATYSQSTPVPLPADSLTSNGTSTTPSLPPQMASVKAHSVDEIVDLMNRTPLFMTDLSPEALADNPELDAIRALQYEGTRAEVAQGFRESGNECARGKAWKDAKEFYTKALAALRAERNEQESGLVLDEEEEGKKEREIKEACYINRALCNLELSESLPPLFSRFDPRALAMVSVDEQGHEELNVNRKLPPNNLGLRAYPPAECQERKSPLSLRPSALVPFSSRRSPRYLHPWAHP